MPEILIYDELGPELWGLISAKSILAQIADIPAGDPLTVRINSAGGDIWEADAIYNAFSRRGGITVEIDSVAASAASYIAMAGARIRIAENAKMMIHNPWTYTAGDARALREQADVLDKHTGPIVAAYAKRSGMSEAEVAELMDRTTWFDAREAVNAGLADEIGQPLAVKACIRPRQFPNQPDDLNVDDPARMAALVMKARRARQIAILRARGQ